VSFQAKMKNAHNVAYTSSNFRIIKRNSVVWRRLERRIRA